MRVLVAPRQLDSAEQLDPVESLRALTWERSLLDMAKLVAAHPRQEERAALIDGAALGHVVGAHLDLQRGFTQERAPAVLAVRGYVDMSCL